MQEENYEKKIGLAEKVLNRNPKADISAIISMKDDENKETPMYVVRAYVLSVVLSPIGVYYFFKLFFFDEEKKAAIICLILTLIVLIIEIKLTSGLFSSSSINNLSPYSGVNGIPNY